MTENFLIDATELLADHDLSDCLIIDARTPDEYGRGHLPGAVFLSTYGCFIPDSSLEGMQHFADDVAQRYASVGVTRDRLVIVYENATGMRAARELWILEYLGYKNVRMLHGGLKAWLEAGGKLEFEDVIPSPTEFLSHIDTSIFISAHEIKEGLGQARRVLIDVRDRDEYNGLDHTECCERRGHIPGAVWLEWTELLESGKYKSKAAIRNILANKGIGDTDELVPYCHRGARSASAYFALRHAGYAHVRNFIGSMHEWSAQKQFNIEI